MLLDSKMILAAYRAAVDKKNVDLDALESFFSEEEKEGLEDQVASSDAIWLLERERLAKR